MPSLQVRVARLLREMAFRSTRTAPVARRRSRPAEPIRSAECGLRKHHDLRQRRVRDHEPIPERAVCDEPLYRISPIPKYFFLHFSYVLGNVEPGVKGSQGTSSH